ncbi:hypothetical protein GCM10009087_02840 [Sphingomonas oligophenolica]|uniref:Zf-HC2 domain-containing protein n=1 Tax=Sphingomonas oligophenolica TaxID=301154 RepID=A0ABU9Y0M4_9SPHN
MGNVVHLRRDRHDEALKLLPWYMTGRLDPADKARVGAHLAMCPACRAELAAERRLRDGVARLAIDMELDWAAFRRARAVRPHSRLAGAVGAALRRRMSRPAALGWLVAAQAALLLVAMPVAPPAGRPAPYRALGAAAQPVAGNIVVMFRPETSEHDLRRVLTLSGARLVDGPTAAHAYVVRVPEAGRGTALATLRAQAAVMLAEPIDQAS